MHWYYNGRLTIVATIKQLMTRKETPMTLIYVLLGFTGLTGAAIALDEFSKLETPKSREQ